MRIKYLGHAAFVLTLSDGRTVVFDPYESGSYDGALAYGPITDAFDIAVVSHDHADHCCTSVTAGAKHVIRSAGEREIDGITVTSIPTFHDESEGSKRGTNLISIIEAEGIRLAHLGDLGHPLPETIADALKGVDVVFVPVGGFFTIDAETALRVIEAIGPKLVIPMHYKTAKVAFPIEPVEKFTGLVQGVEHAGTSEITVTRESLPAERTVVVLDQAL
ncbi:MAG TPA: MBL fold metallo-hydrolase [Patescibacteria group bacterium]|nr:MBL fold metallo-hydrolase [Patescibacteria group bacterium]